MVQRTSLRQDRLMRTFGENIRRWRKVNRMTATDLANRAFVTRETLREIEKGSGAVRFESVFAVLSVLGLAEPVVSAVDPFTSDSARSRIDEILGAGGTL